MLHPLTEAAVLPSRTSTARIAAVILRPSCTWQQLESIPLKLELVVLQAIRCSIRPQEIAALTRSPERIGNFNEMQEHHCNCSISSIANANVAVPSDRRKQLARATCALRRPATRRIRRSRHGAQSLLEMSLKWTIFFVSCLLYLHHSGAQIVLPPTIGPIGLPTGLPTAQTPGHPAEAPGPAATVTCPTLGGSVTSACLTYLPLAQQLPLNSTSITNGTLLATVTGVQRQAGMIISSDCCSALSKFIGLGCRCNSQAIKFLQGSGYNWIQVQNAINAASITCEVTSAITIADPTAGILSCTFY
ncbi:hypothetical protein WJX73_004015 [Symbiochloris irregularis]|uniref:Bifunctional inhibitor/plant lipid transfer protein/seed storage helical domain-containing protein n=1 Tax=Symbiochloris irregularis TaxID=706552 RepID=A0AAW1PZ32_9CHLO